MPGLLLHVTQTHEISLHSSAVAGKSKRIDCGLLLSKSCRKVSPPATAGALFGPRGPSVAFGILHRPAAGSFRRIGRTGLMPRWLRWSVLALLSWGVWAIMAKLIGDALSGAHNQALSTLGILPVMLAFVISKKSSTPGSQLRPAGADSGQA